LKTKPQEITSAEDLAKRMAFLTRYIRDAIVADYAAGAPSNKVREWRKRLAKDLITDLEQPQKTEEFADMFAQTLAYGLFSARTMDTTPESFTREEAQSLIPATNPFLQEFFYEITGPSLRNETFAPFVDDLVALLAFTKMDMVLEDFGKGREGHDPVIHFYETFLAAYDPKLRESRGVYYTPEPVVQYIVRSVDWLLRERFGLRDGLGSRERFRDENKDPNLRLVGQDRAGMRKTVMRHRVQVLDPACGTGTFLFAMVNLIRERMMARGDAGEWSDYVREDLLPRMYGFELLMAPYAVAHFKLGLQLAGGDLPEEIREKWRYDFSSNERLNVFLTNTLEEAHPAGATPMFDVVGRESVEADAVKRDLPILVVMGNPPYSGHSSNKGKWIMGLLRGKDGARDTVNYFEVDGKPLGEKNPKWLNDDYVKFIRFAQWRIDKTEQGVLAFISNNGYLDNPTFRGMRQALMETFTDIYILDLHGSSKKKEVAPDGSKDENVFDIQQGVAIGIFVKEAGKQGPAQVHHAGVYGLREEKYLLLSEADLSGISTGSKVLSPQAPFYLFVPQDTYLMPEYTAWWQISDVLNVNSVGVVTGQDTKTIAFTRDEALALARKHGLEEDTVIPILY
jgi:predicted helicase